MEGRNHSVVGTEVEVLSEDMVLGAILAIGTIIVEGVAAHFRVGLEAVICRTRVSLVIVEEGMGMEVIESAGTTALALISPREMERWGRASAQERRMKIDGPSLISSSLDLRSRSLAGLGALYQLSPRGQILETIRWSSRSL